MRQQVTLGAMLDEADDLYGLPLGEFTATRDALAARLKAAGDKEAAAEVKRARKPSVPAWAANPSRLLLSLPSRLMVPSTSTSPALTFCPASFRSCNMVYAQATEISRSGLCHREWSLNS